jgi:sugar phosphate isomerase/epimerase
MIYVSTGGIKNQPAWKTSEDFLKHGIKNIELSGGLSHSDNFKKLKQLKARVHFQVHNYFPPPEKPFVLNLSSLNPSVAKRSIEHAKTAMQWAVEIARPIYSFHAGYLIDPKIDELGKRISNKKLFARKSAINVLLDRINDLSQYALGLGVELLIENNVLSANNLKEFGTNPFLMANADECVYVMENTPSNVNLLIDVAHLKVSAKSLKFDPVIFLHKCDKWIRAHHLSDNDGKMDSNEPITEKSWFWPHLKKDLDYYSLEIYNVSVGELIKELNLTEKILNQ